MSKKMVMTGPGRVVNRAAKHGKIDLAVDPSPAGFLSDARQQKERIKVLVIPGDGNTDPIEIYAHPKSLVLRCEGAMIPPGRLADLEALITEEKDVHIVIEYVPKQDQLPFTRTETSQNREAIDPSADGATPAGAKEPAVPEINEDGVFLFPQRLSIAMPKGVRGLAEILYAQDNAWYGGFRLEIGREEVVKKCIKGEVAYDSAAYCLEDMQQELKQAVTNSKRIKNKPALLCAIDKAVADRLATLKEPGEPEEFAEDDPQEETE